MSRNDNLNFEIGGSIGLPATISRIQFLGGKLLPTIFNTYENISDFGLMKGTVETFKDVAANQRAKRGMTYILDELEKFGIGPKSRFIVMPDNKKPISALKRIISSNGIEKLFILFDEI